MKVAIAASRADLGAEVEPRFGRCDHIVIVDTETMQLERLENPGALAGTGAGVAAAQLVADAGAEAVVAGNFGPTALHALRAGGIPAYHASGTVQEAAQAVADGRLQAIE